MSRSQFALLKTRRFAPLFATQFFGALHDNIFKSALVAILLFDTSGGLSQADQDTKILVTLATAVFIMPFILFSALAGQYMDKYPKDLVIRKIKLAELGIAVLGAVSLLSGSIIMAFATLFALGTQSAFFGPGKYAILPQHLDEHELVGGNAMVGVGTFLAIIIGTVLGMVLINVPQGKLLLSLGFVLFAVSGYAASRLIPRAQSYAPDLNMNYNMIRQTYHMVGTVLQSRKMIIRCALGIAWFWFMGSVFLSQMPNFTRLILGADEHVSALFMVLFSVGIGLGGLGNELLLKGDLSARYVSLGALGVSVFVMDLCWAGALYDYPSQGGDLIQLAAFLSTASGWRIVMDTFFIACFAGLYVVPLNAIFQKECGDENRARMLAGLAVMNACFMVMASVISALVFSSGLGVPHLFLGIAVANSISIFAFRKIQNN